MKKSLVKVNSIVQINETGVEGWTGCLVQVTELKGFGIQGYVQIPKGGPAYIRLNWDQFEYVGEATMIPSDEPTT